MKPVAKLILAWSSLSFITSINAATIVVDELLDSNATTKCSLRSAIIAANDDIDVNGCNAGDSGLDTIVLKAGHYYISDNLPKITDSLEIIGQNNILGSTTTRIDALTYFAQSQIFYFDPTQSTGKTLLLKGLYLSYGLGSARGASFQESGCVAINGSHNVTLDHVRLSYCYGTHGGGLSYASSAAYTGNVGTLNIKWSQIEYNEAYEGAGMFLFDPVNLNMENTLVYQNKVTTNGAGIYSKANESTYQLSSEYNITRSSIFANVTDSFNPIDVPKGGGIYIQNIAPASGNSAYHQASLDVYISHSTIKNNLLIGTSTGAGGEGAGLYLIGGSNLHVDLYNTELYNNSVKKGVLYAYDHNFIIQSSEVLTSSGYNALGQGWDFGTSPWTSPYAPPGTINTNKDYVLLPSNSFFSGIDKGYCETQQYDINGNGWPVGSTSRREVDDVNVTNGYGDAICDIGAYEAGAIPVVDYDGDGVLDVNDAFPLDASESVDTDGDGIGNNADTDDDGDNVLDVNDAFPLDASESVDTDGDGIGNNADTDDDGDNVPDVNDAFPLDASESVDTDGDGVGNNTDIDDDNDGISDVYETTLGFDPLDANSTPLDTDGDGTPDAIDTDDDDDGISDSDEVILGFDPLDASDGLADSDSDGFSNALEFSIGTNMNDATDKPVWSPILMDDIMIFITSKP